MRRIAALMLLCVFGGLFPSATLLALAAPQQLLPVCCRAHGAHACGSMAEMAASTPASDPQVRQIGCPYGQGLHAITTATITADFAYRTRIELTVTGLSQQHIADAIAARFLRRSAPRGPPSSFSFAI
jgi:hypothetical protein